MIHSKYTAVLECPAGQFGVVFTVLFMKLLNGATDKKEIEEALHKLIDTYMTQLKEANMSQAIEEVMEKYFPKQQNNAANMFASMMQSMMQPK